MDFYETEEDILEYRALSIPALVGGVLGFLSPLALVRGVFCVLPILGILLSLWGLYSISRRPTVLTGKSLARWGLTLGLFFGAAGILNSSVYYVLNVRSGRHFAQQWLTLALEGRDKEACQLGQTSLSRLTGRGIEVGFQKNPTFVTEYAQFQDNYTVQYLLKYFRGGRFDYLGLEKTQYFRKRRTRTYGFEVSVGEGNMRMSRNFYITVECQKIDNDYRYEWRWLRTTFTPT